MRKGLPILFIICLLFALTSCAQSMSDDDVLARAKQIEAEREKEATPTPEPTKKPLPIYKVEGISNNYMFLDKVFYMYITVSGDYTMDDLIEISRKEYRNDGLEYWVNFFEPNAPRVEDTKSDTYGLPDKKYAVAEIGVYTFQDEVDVRVHD